jgi:mRNA interferase RelE/StbE
VNTWVWKVSPPAERDIRRLDRPVRQRIFDALDRFTTTYPHGDVVRLQGIDPPEYRLRVGDWRVRFRPDLVSNTIFVLRVLPRGEAYR